MASFLLVEPAGAQTPFAGCLKRMLAICGRKA
jgi:hypothetical protein